METKIINEKKNPFLERTEFELEIKNEIAPSSDEVKTELGKDADLTVVKKVNASFGNQVFAVEAVVYDNKEAKEKVETIPQKVRKKMAEEAKAAAEAEKKAAEEAKKAEEEAKAAEAEATEKPAEEEAAPEETKEEAPAEEKPAEEESSKDDSEEPKTE